MPAHFRHPVGDEVRHGRGAIQDEIGSMLNARLSLMLLGERPGPGSADSLGTYFTYLPGPGRTDYYATTTAASGPPSGQRPKLSR